MPVIEDNLTAYPRVLLSDEEPLPPAFHERFPALFIGRRTTGAVWPDHSENEAAVAAYREGYQALHEDKDPIAAIGAYERALEQDPMYFRAWVDLAIAFLLDNTAESIDRAEGIFAQLAAIEPDGSWLTREVASMIRQNLGYTRVVRYRRTGDKTYLKLADTEYAQSDTLAEQERIELLCPWTFVKVELGEIEKAHTLWRRAVAAAPSEEVLAEYASKYASLRPFLGENKP